ncbi:MAG: hypothetical protein ACREGH_03345 [Minisyncoccia bacterium]
MESDASNVNIVLRDLSDSINERFNLVFKEFATFKTINVSNETRLKGLQQAAQDAHIDLQTVKGVLRAHDSRFTEILDELHILSNAFDKDAVTLVKLEARASALEGKNSSLSTTN